MPATLGCPHCRGAVTVPDEMMGGGVTCPHCRGVFAAAMPPPPPARAKPVKKDPFAFADEPARDDHEEDDDEPRPRKRRPEQPKFQFTLGAVIVMILTGLAAVVLAVVRNELPRPAGGGFDVPRVVVSGLIGGVVAGGIGVARYLGTPAGGRAKYNRRR